MSLRFLYELQKQIDSVAPFGIAIRSPRGVKQKPDPYTGPARMF